MLLLLVVVVVVVVLVVVAVVVLGSRGLTTFRPRAGSSPISARFFAVSFLLVLVSVSVLELVLLLPLLL